MALGGKWSHRIDVSVDAETKRELTKLAKANETSLAQQVRVAISYYLMMQKS